MFLNDFYRGRVCISVRNEEDLKDVKKLCEEYYPTSTYGTSRAYSNSYDSFYHDYFFDSDYEEGKIILNGANYEYWDVMGIKTPSMVGIKEALEKIEENLEALVKGTLVVSDKGEVGELVYYNREEDTKVCTVQRNNGQRVNDYICKYRLFGE